MKKRMIPVLIFVFFSLVINAQSKKTAATQNGPAKKDSIVIPVSNADLGTFPYFKPLRNFYVNDSNLQESNRTYFYDGKKLFSIEGKVAALNLTVKNSDQKSASIFECVQEFDKVVAALGGIKFYTGKLPEEELKKITGEDIVSLGSRWQVVPSAYYGVVEYVIKTPGKEVWIQLQPYSLASHFYTLLVVEKGVALISLNTNKINTILQDLEKNKKAIVRLEFEPDTDKLLSASNDEILSIAGVFQAHAEWKLTLNVHNAPTGTAAYTKSLTEKRAAAVKMLLTNLGIKDASVTVTGMGDQQPLVPNDNEQARITNTRIEISLQ